MTIALAGHGGFLGTGIVAALRRQNEAILLLPPVRYGADERLVWDVVEEVIEGRLRAPLAVTVATVADLLLGEPVSALIIAAGVADASSDDDIRLYGGNALVPILLCAAAAKALVPKVLYISSAAVQGRTKLDALPRWEPLTPYGRSKALGERKLLECAKSLGVQVCVFRAASVHDDSRELTVRAENLFKRLPVIPLAVPVITSPVVGLNGVVTQALAALASGRNDSIILQVPSASTLQVLHGLAPGTWLLPLPRRLVTLTFDLLHVLPLPTRIRAALRRLEVIVAGQEFATGALPARPEPV